MLMWACDLIVAAENAYFADVVGTRLGMCGIEYFGHPWEFGPRRAKELMLTGKLLSGKTCVEWGLCNASAPAGELDRLVADFVGELIDKSPFCMWMTKMAANRGMDADTDSLIVLETMTCNVVHHSDDAKDIGGARAISCARCRGGRGRRLRHDPAAGYPRCA